MIECSTLMERHFTACASLAALGIQLTHLDVFGPIRETVCIEQKTLKHAPSDKLYDAFISPAFRRSRVGGNQQSSQSRSSLAKSVRTLPMCRAVGGATDAGRLYRHDGQANGASHGYDLPTAQSGLPARLSNQLATPGCGHEWPAMWLQSCLRHQGYFAKQRNRRGRQLGRVLASHYAEIVVDRLFDGKTQLTKALQPLMHAAERTLQLDKAKRARTIVRVDSGGGSLDDLNWLLSRGYQIHAKDYSSRHARGLAKSVLVWFDDPHAPERQAGPGQHLAQQKAL
jgi:hypothetical protein